MNLLLKYFLKLHTNTINDLNKLYEKNTLFYNNCNFHFQL